MKTKSRSNASARRQEITRDRTPKIKDLERHPATGKNLPANESEAVKGGSMPVDHTIDVPIR